MLTVNELVVHYGRSKIISELSLEVKSGELVCVLGRNGVGKTTLLKAILNIESPTEGSVIFNDEDVTGAPTYKISRSGIGYVPQSRDIFPDLTVEENLRLPLYATGQSRDLTEIFDLFPFLGERAEQQADTLSGGQKQMLAIGRALSTNPELLLMDEPSEGIQPSIVNDLKHLLNDLKTSTSILLVEQNVGLAKASADRCYVMERGQIMAEGEPHSMELEELIAA